MVLLLGGLIGFIPAFVALTLYSLLPILANTVTGIRGVDPALTEAARGLGMSDRQLLCRVQLPLAAPVILAGIRTATVLVVGTATLVTPVGGLCLGNYIFAGLESLNATATVFGCVLAALLAVVLDQLVRLLEVAARRRSRTLAWAGAAGLLLVVVGGLYTPVARFLSQRASRAVVASGPFTEQHILSEVLARKLERAGFWPDKRQGMSEGIQFEALRHNQVDCIVNYSGNIWTLVMKRKDYAEPQAILKEVNRHLREAYGVVCLGSLGFEDAYAFAMRKDRGIHAVDELARYAAERARQHRPLKIAGDSQFFDRPEWRRIKESYGLKEGEVETIAMDPTLMYGAVRDEQVDVIVAYTSDGRITYYDLEILQDPRQAFPPYDAVLLLSPKASRNAELVAALESLLDAIPVEAMREANGLVDVHGKRPREVGAALLEKIERGK
jgi:osmoprotectant transport system permease protein